MNFVTDLCRKRKKKANHPCFASILFYPRRRPRWGTNTAVQSCTSPRKGNDSASLLVRYCIAEKCIVAAFLTNVKQLQPQVTAGLQPVSATTLLQVLVLRHLIWKFLYTNATQNTYIRSLKSFKNFCSSSDCVKLDFLLLAFSCRRRHDDKTSSLCSCRCSCPSGNLDARSSASWDTDSTFSPSAFRSN